MGIGYPGNRVFDNGGAISANISKFVIFIFIAEILPGLLGIEHAIVVKGGGNGKTLQHGCFPEGLDAQTQRDTMPVSVFYIIPHLAGEQERVGGRNPVLQQTGITELYVLVKPGRPYPGFTLERGDPGHVKRNFGEGHAYGLGIAVLTVIQGSTHIKGTVGPGLGVGDTGLFGTPHHTVDVVGMILIVGGTGKVHTGPE
jgi:hypothetical protein